MNIPIKTNIFNFYYLYLRSLSLILPCTDKSKKVLSNLMLLQYSNKRDDVLARECRKAIRNKLKISESSFNNSIYELKKYNAIDSNNKINKKLMIDPGKEFSITYTFKL